MGINKGKKVKTIPATLSRFTASPITEQKKRRVAGYARVSTDDQDTDAQTASLRKAGCERVFTEKASGGRWDRPELAKALEQLRAGDVLVVWKLDRLSRSLKDLLTIIERIDAALAGNLTL